VGQVADDGTFDVPRVAPGHYRLTIGRLPTATSAQAGDFVDTTIDVADSDLVNLSYSLGPGGVMTGRVVADGNATLESTVGLVVQAVPSPEELGRHEYVTGKVAADGSFAIRGLSGTYQLVVSAARPPGIEVRRIVRNGVQLGPNEPLTIVSGAIDLTIIVGPREPPKSTIDRSLSTIALVELFKAEKTDFRQFEIAEAIVERGDMSVLPGLEAFLTHDHRRVRGNAAFVFAKLGDSRGFSTIAAILADRSDRAVVASEARGNGNVQAQIRSDRYYAAHLLGDLRDPRGTAFLIPLLKDPDVRDIVPWALGQIGDVAAIPPLIETLDESDPSMVVLAIYALQTLKAKDALPRLTALLEDRRSARFGNQVSTADAARDAIAKIR